MTTLQQNQPPVFCYDIWRTEDGIHGSIIDWKPWWQAQRDYECSYDLKGQQAHYILVTHDRSITRAEGISFAKALHEGKVSRLRVDLTPCNPKPKK